MILQLGHENWVLLMRQCHIMILNNLKLCNEKILTSHLTCIMEANAIFIGYNVAVAPGRGGGWEGVGGGTRVNFCFVPLASQSPHPIIVYSVSNYRPHLKSLFGQM